MAESIISKSCFILVRKSLLLQEDAEDKKESGEGEKPRANQFPRYKGNAYISPMIIWNLFYLNHQLDVLTFAIFNMEDKTIKPLLSNRFHPTFLPPVLILPPL